jgi:hypothetical protein
LDKTGGDGDEGDGTKKQWFGDNKVLISEEAVKHQLQQNKRLLDLPKPKDTGGFQ